MAGISVVINTLNQAKDLKRAINSVKWADEILICNMGSDNETVKIAGEIGARVISHKKLEHVEPARNFAISNAKNDWILIIDPDEEVSENLRNRLVQIASKMEQIDYVRIPRKNLIFDKWMKASMWWPDYNVRFFKKGKVKWNDKIHRPPEVIGQGLDLPAEEKWSIIHYHYGNIPQFLERMNRYTGVQANELNKEGYKFDWRDLIKKPLGEFLGRFFASRGYQDGIHGLALSLLQAFSQLFLYLKLWEMEKFKQVEINLSDLNVVSKQAGKEIDYWFKNVGLSQNPFKRFVQKVKSKI